MVTLRKLALGLAAMLAVFACATAAIAQAPPAHGQGGQGASHKGIYWGAWIGPQLTGEQPPWDMSAADRFAGLIGKQPSLLQFSQPFADCGGGCEQLAFPTAEMTAIRSYGAVPLLSWGSQATGRGLAQPDYAMARIAGGAHDAYIREFAEGARNWGHPFFLRFNWEMNGGWFPWGVKANGNTAAKIVAAWRHVHDIFTTVGATNVSWVWCPYVDGSSRFGDLQDFYPGNPYVDWTCLDGYNWGANLINPAPWRSFDQIFSASYRQLTEKIAPHKPVMLGEVATNGTAKVRARWIKGMFAAIAHRYPQIRGLAWFDQSDRGLNWSLEQSPRVVKAFANGVRASRFRPGSYGSLDGSPILPPR
jgi:Glycosyl hydrolase family 26